MNSKSLWNNGLAKKIAWFAIPTMLFSASFFFFQPKQAAAHCDSLGGPVVAAAKQALETGKVEYVLPFVKPEGEAELTAAFQKALAVRRQGPKAQELADYWFYETAVRIHREGEGAAYTGLKPAGVDYGPALPAAEEAIATGSADKVKELILHAVAEGIEKEFAHVMELRSRPDETVEMARERIEAELMFEKYILGLWQSAQRLGGHVEGGEGHTEAAPAGHEH